MGSIKRDHLKKYIPSFILRFLRFILNLNPIPDWRAERSRARLIETRRTLLSTSQAGQDYWVYGEVFNEKRQGYFVDIGAHDGIYLSNTFLLEDRYDWDGICIEANRESFEALQNNRRAISVNVCVDERVGTVDFVEASVFSGIVARDCDNAPDKDGVVVEMATETLAGLLNRLNAPKIIDYLSIDIEGAEDRALLSFPFGEYQFRSMTIERPSQALRATLTDHGYQLIKEIPGLDCFYIHSSFYSQYWKNLIAFHQKKFLIGCWEI